MRIRAARIVAQQGDRPLMEHLHVGNTSLTWEYVAGDAVPGNVYRHVRLG